MSYERGYDVLTVSAGRNGARDLTNLMNSRTLEGWEPWMNAMEREGLLMQVVTSYGEGGYADLYDYTMLQARTGNELVTKVRELMADGWEPYSASVAGQQYMYQWMLRTREPIAMTEQELSDEVPA